MIISRALAFISFSFVVMILGAEGLRTLQKEEGGWITVCQVTEFVFGETINKQSEENSGDFASFVWRTVYEPVADFPAVFVFMIITILFVLVSRRRSG